VSWGKVKLFTLYLYSLCLHIYPHPIRSIMLPYVLYIMSYIRVIIHYVLYIIFYTTTLIHEYFIPVMNNLQSFMSIHKATITCINTTYRVSL